VAAIGVAALGGVATVHAQSASSRCADCHIANQQGGGGMLSANAARHLQDWDLSSHGRASVGCEKCHGGDASTFEKFLAHRDILPTSSPASPVNRVNLPRTCGTCHTGPFVAFQKSRHYDILRGGDDRGPTCSTCHGEVAAYLLSPNSLANACNRCHGPGRPVARGADRAADAKLLMSDTREVREALNHAKSLIGRVKDKASRAKYEEAWQQAEVPLIEARNAGHQFVFDNSKERLALARTRVTALLDALANPPR
jgi:hypothetical protein